MKTCMNNTFVLETTMKKMSHLLIGDFFWVLTQGAEESCLTVMLAQFIAQIDLVIQNNEHD